VATYHYTALSSTGARVSGILSAVSEQAVLIELESRRLTPVSIKEEAGGAAPRRRIGQRALGESYTQLADLLKAGVPLLRGLRLLAGRKATPNLAAVYRELAEAVEKGADLGVAMSNDPGVFPQVHIAMVRAGEKGGFLEDVLHKLGAMVVKQAELRAKIVGNLVYPMVLVAMGLVVGGVIFGVFVPKFRPMFDKIQGGLPWITKAVFVASDALTMYGPLTALGLGVVGFAVWRTAKRPALRDRIARWQARAPVIGPIVRGVATARLCRLLGAMLGNGVPLIAALQIAKDGTGNALMRAAVENASESVRAGQPLTPPLAASGLIDDDIAEMIAVGESANNLDDVLVTVSETIENRLDRVLGVAVRLIEPLLLVALAGIVGIVAAALLLPMSRMGGSM